MGQLPVPAKVQHSLPFTRKSFFASEGDAVTVHMSRVFLPTCTHSTSFTYCIPLGFTHCTLAEPVQVVYRVITCFVLKP